MSLSGFSLQSQGSDVSRLVAGQEREAGIQIEITFYTKANISVVPNTRPYWSRHDGGPRHPSLWSGCQKISGPPSANFGREIGPS